MTTYQSVNSGYGASAGSDTSNSHGAWSHEYGSASGDRYGQQYAGSSTGAIPSGTPSFEVHLGSLREFGRELQDQITALQRAVSALSDPGHKTVPFGDFPEATNLARRHAASLEGMADLLAKVKAAITFADRVTDTVAESYEAGDLQAAGTLRRTTWT